MTDLFETTSKIQNPEFCFADNAKFFGLGLATALVPSFLFHSVKQLAVQENIALFAAVLICAALLLAVAYRAWAVYGSRRYMHRSDLLTRTFTKPETDARVTAIHHMGRVFAIALVNVAYIALAFICSFQRIFGRFELSSAYALTVGVPACALAFLGYFMI